MLVKCNVDSFEIENISHSVTLVPRLKYAVDLLDKIIDVLTSKQDELKNSNTILISDFDESDKTNLDALKLEYLIILSLGHSSSNKEKYEKNF